MKEYLLAAALAAIIPQIYEDVSKDEAYAICILQSPPRTPVECPSVFEFHGRARAIRNVCIRWEILDARETYYLAERGSWAQDIDTLRQRRIDFEDAPRIEFVERFPNREYLNGLCSFNRRFRSHVEKLWEMELDRRAYYEVVMSECDESYRLIDQLRDYQCDFYMVTVRRRAAQSFRNSVGEEMWLSGEVPPAWPSWRFREMNR